MTIKQLSAFALPMAMLSQVSAKERPNILFIYADDQCFQSLFAADREGLQTPNLDRLMANGTSFVQAHNQGSWTPGVSSASRSMMVTGEFLWKAAQFNNVPATATQNTPRVQPEFTVKKSPMPTLLPKLVGEAGYETYMAGKWHIAVGADKVFDHTGTVRAGMPAQHQDCYDRLFDVNNPDKWTPWDTSYGGFWKGGQHWSEVLRDETLGFLDHSKSVDKPFFMYIAFNAAHDPRQSPKEFVDMYPADDIAVPESFLPVYPYADEVGAGFFLRDEMLAPFPRNERSVQVNRQEYYAIITHMDRQIGEIFAKLDEMGVADNTYILFTADHGIAIGDHGFMGKQNMYEKSVRVPLIVSGPGVKKGAKVDEFVYLQDVMPTVLDIAGVEKPERVDFNSLLPMATGKSKKSAYDMVYGAYMGVQRMVKDGEYKMMIYPNVNVVRLYNLKKDPQELNDLASDPKYKSKMVKLFAELKKLQVEVEDPLDVTPYFNAFIEKL